MTRSNPGIYKVPDVTLKRGVADAADAQDQFANLETNYLPGQGGNGSSPSSTPEFADFNTSDPGITPTAAEFVIFRIGQKIATPQAGFGEGLARFVFEPNSPETAEQVTVDNLLRRQLRVSDPSDPQSTSETADTSQPFGHEIGLSHDHQPPSEAAAPPRLIILDEPTTAIDGIVDDLWA